MFNCLELLICIMVLFFPLLIYSYYILYKKNYKEKVKRLILNLSLFITLFLIINVVEYFSNMYYLIFCTIPILFAYIYRNKFMIVFISLIVSIYVYFTLEINIAFILFLNLVYIITYSYYSKSNKKPSFLINTFCISSIVLLILSLMVEEKYDVINFKLFIIIIIYIITIILVQFALKKTNEVINIYMTLKEIEREKQIKTSLFKITHEIKNPLAVVNGYLQMYNARDIKKSEKYVNIIRTEVKRMLNLLDDFNEFTKIKIEKKEIDFNELLEDVKQTVIPISKKYKVRYKFKSEEDLVVNLDYNRMKQVIINLVKNAIEASKNGGSVDITAYKDQSKLYICIKDNGVGMSKETMDNLLKPFYTTKTFGTGLGVCLSNEIVVAHGGSLEYTSKLREGTHFKIILPL